MAKNVLMLNQLLYFAYILLLLSVLRMEGVLWGYKYELLGYKRVAWDMVTDFHAVWPYLK